jgi:prevent-host-death family protein
MDKSMSLSDARKNLPQLIKEISEIGGRITITVNGKPKATLTNSEEFESLEETADVLSIPGAKDSILKGLKEAKNEKGVSLPEIE